MAQHVYAETSEGNFRIVEERVEDSIAYIDWEFDLDLGNPIDSFGHTFNFTTDNPIEDRDLIADDGTLIGRYSISADGELIVEIDEEIYAETRDDDNADPVDEESATDDGNIDEIDEEDEVDENLNEEDGTDEDTGTEDDDKAEDENDETEDAETGDETEDNDAEADAETGDGDAETENETEDEDGEASSEGYFRQHVVYASATEVNEIKTLIGTIIIPGVTEKPGLFNRMVGLFGVDDGKDLGNIFTFDFLKLGEEDITDLQEPIEIEEGTTLQLQYKWDTLELGVNPGDWSEIEVPDAFKLDRDWEDLDIKLGKEGPVVGKYSLINNKLKFVFDEGITEVASGVRNGFVGFGVKFNEEKFQKDVVQEIKFNDVIGKTITIVGKHGGEISAIFKKGEPDATKDAKNITWTIDIANPGDSIITNATLKDIIPAGLKLIKDSINVTNLTVGLDGKLYEAGEYSVTPVTGTEDGKDTFEIEFSELRPYKGYRIEYTTVIMDYSADASFTNDATLKYVDSGDLKAETTVTDLDRSELIEKEGKYLGNDEIEWKILINKPLVGIEYAKIYEKLPYGLTVIENSVEVYELNKNGENWNVGSEVEEFKVDTIDSTEFTVILGEVAANQAYMIKFKTGIDYSEINDGEYKREGNIFTNKAILKNEENIEIGDAEGNVTITREPIIKKTEISNITYTNKTISWQLEINKAKHPLQNVIVVDILPAGLGITEDNIQIYKSDGTTEAIGFVDWITIAEDSEDNTKITMALGDIGTEHYKIKYTANITDFGKGNFPNGATISGGGVGIGSGWDYSSKTISINENNYTKRSTSIDYNNKTISWEIKVDPRREPIKGLKIIDTFPNRGLILLPETLEVKLVKLETEELLTEGEDKDYTLEANTVIDDNVDVTGYQKGFTIKFLNITEENPLEDKIITITYQTSFDPEEGIDESTSTETKDKYQNKAQFIGKTLTREIDTFDIAKVDERQDSWDAGKKVGKLISIDKSESTVDGWHSGNERKIRWEVYINYLEQDLGAGVTVTDELGYEGKIDETSIEVRKYIVAANGDTTLGDVVEGLDYTVTHDGDKKITLTFNGAVEERYAIVFTTSVPDISEETYSNTATTKVSGKLALYTGSIGFSDYNKNLSKTSLGVIGGKVYTDDELQWKIKINESLSVIQKDVKVVDTISEGLVYKDGSLEIKEVGNDDEFTDYELDVEVNSSGETILTIIFNNLISSTYEISYTTVVIATDGQVNNRAEYSGANEYIDSVETSELNAQ